MNIKVTNVSAKNITLANGMVIKPKQKVIVKTRKNSELYNQLKNLEKLRVVLLAF